MSVGREVKIAVGSECRETFVAGCIDGFSKVLHFSQAVGGKSNAP